MTSVRDALVRWRGILNRLPGGTGIDTTEEGASPGAGTPFVVSLIIHPDGKASALVIGAGSYDGAPRVFAEVFEGTQDEVGRAVQDWKRDRLR